MDGDAMERAAEILAELRVRPEFRLNALPDEATPPTIDEAYDIQELVHDRLRGRGLGEVIGHKLACTTRVMQQRIGIDHPCPGGVFANRVYQGHVDIPRATAFRAMGCENEICVVMGTATRPEDAPFSAAHIRDRTEALMTCMEIGHSRYTYDEETRKNDARTIVADDSWGWGCVLAEPVTDWQSLDLSRLVARTILNGEVIGEGYGDLPLGDPFAAVAWLDGQRRAHPPLRIRALPRGPGRHLEAAAHAPLFDLDALDLARELDLSLGLRADRDS
ncbi:MAG: hypothetical protein RII27_09440 [Alphaproteobacteria bacterium]